MTAIQWINAVLEAVGALGLLCSALSKLPLGKTSDVLSHLGTNFIAAAREMRSQPPPTEPPKHITIPGGGA